MTQRTWLVFTLFSLVSLAAFAQPDLRQLVAGAPLIVRGTTLGAAESPGAFRIRVDETLRGAGTIGDFTKQEIVVIAAHEPRKGATFFLRPMVYGKTLVAQELAELDISAEAVATAEQQNADAALSARVATAEAVVVARVIDVRPADRERGDGSEHDPDWAVARLSIVRALKGQLRTDVEVAFAQSDDIRWFRSPKLAQGQQAIVLLRPLDPKQLRDGEKPPARFVLIDPEDLRPLSDEARIVRMIRATR